MTLQKLNIQPKVDNAAKKKMVTSNTIGTNETLLANEVNALVAKTNELVDAANNFTAITGFNFKENKPTYASLGLVVDPQKDDAYGVLADGLIYIYNGTSWPAEGNGLDLGLKPTGIVAEGVEDAVSGNTVYQQFYNKDKNLAYFTDDEDKVYGTVDENGKFDIELSESAKILNFGKYEDENQKSSLLIIDPDNKVHFEANSLKLPPLISNKAFELLDIRTIKKKINFEITAIGRSTTLTSDDAPTVLLQSNGVTHPKCLYFENALFGYNYWMALTPTFGPIAEQPGPAYFENPHILCSNNAVDWIEPNPKPIDVTAPYSYSNTPYPFWSDTHLTFGGDGYLYCYYRGVNMPRDYVTGNTEDDGYFGVVVVRRKTNDGINWSEREVVASTDDEGFDKDSSLLSPALDYNNHILNYFDLVSSTSANPIISHKNQNHNFINRRYFENGNLNKFSQDKIINLINRPWGASHNTWHLDYLNVNGLHLLLLNIGLNGASMGNDLYLAYSFDGWNFNVFETPIYVGNSYRSSISINKIENNIITLDLFRSDTTDGNINLMQITIKI